MQKKEKVQKESEAGRNTRVRRCGQQGEKRKTSERGKEKKAP